MPSNQGEHSMLSCLNTCPSCLHVSTVNSQPILAHAVHAATLLTCSAAPALGTALAARSEEECFELLVKELLSIPDREVPVSQNGDTSPEGGQLTPVTGKSFRVRRCLSKD